MSRLLYRLGRWSAAHPWRMVALWVLAAVLAAGAATVAGGAYDDNYAMSGTSSTKANDLLTAHNPELSGATATVVLHDAAQAVPESVVGTLATKVGDLPHVTAVQPQVSADRRTVALNVQYDLQITEVTELDGFGRLRTATAAVTDGTGLQVEYGGWVAEQAQPMTGQAEMIGIAVALVILLLAFGSVVAAGLPLLVALLGLGIGTAGITVLSSVVQVSSVAPTLATMVGLGVGIDYALFVLTRHREGLRSGHSPVDSAAAATATAGQAVLFAGTSVIISLGGLALCGVPNLVTLGAAPGIVVAVSMVAAVTLVPALLGLAGLRVLRRKERRELAAGWTPVSQPVRTSAAVRWARLVSRRPVAWGVAAVVLLLALGAPALAMRTGQPDAGTAAETSTVRKAHDLVAAAFGPGSLSPFVVVADTSRVPAGEVAGLSEQIAALPGVAAVSPVSPSRDGAVTVISVVPAYGAQDQRTGQLLRQLRDDVLPDGVYVSGATAINADFSDRMDQRLPWVVVAVVVTSALLLLLAFRSVAVPVKAAVMNLLSLGAAMGVVTAIFSWGWGAAALGTQAGAPIPAYLPVITFAILFGLSMDYEVFIMSRTREEWLRLGDPHRSVLAGLGSTARVVTSAAAIMVAVFAGFAADPLVDVKMIGVALATAILVDATVVRMVLLPATMTLLGSRAWWLPDWLDRVLPRVELHGSEALPTELDLELDRLHERPLQPVR
jgi:putative drug exporter of the RND superfamily